MLGQRSVAVPSIGLVMAWCLSSAGLSCVIELLLSSPVYIRPFMDKYNHIYIALQRMMPVLYRPCSTVTIWANMWTDIPEMKWNESGFRPPLCTYRLNWARRTSWGWWDDWDDIVLQIQDSKFEPWRSEADHATSRSRRLPTILTFPRGWGRNIFCFCFKPPRPGTEPRTLAWKAAVLLPLP